MLAHRQANKAKTPFEINTKGVIQNPKQYKWIVHSTNAFWEISGIPAQQMQTMSLICSNVFTMQSEIKS